MSYTTRIWQQPSWIGSSNEEGSFNSTDRPEGRGIFRSKRTCPVALSLPKFPESVCHNFRNPHEVIVIGDSEVIVIGVPGIVIGTPDPLMTLPMGRSCSRQATLDSHRARGFLVARGGIPSAQKATVHVMCPLPLCGHLPGPRSSGLL